MARILFMNGGAEGHVNPTVSVVRELVQRGNEVVYFTTEYFRERLEKVGAEVRAYDFHRFFEGFLKHGIHPLDRVNGMLEGAEALIPYVLEEAKAKPFDYIVHDSMFGGGRLMAHLLQLPAINSSSSFAMMAAHFKHFIERLDAFVPSGSSGQQAQEDFDRLAARLRRDYGYVIHSPYEAFFNPEPLTIVYTSRLFQPKREDFDDSYKYVGPSVSARLHGEPEMPELAGKSVIYISLGTEFNKDIDFYRSCFEAFGGSGNTIVMSVGRQTEIESLGAIPDNFIVRPYVPQLEVLQHARLFITHGGMNSTNEGLSHGLPLVLVPQGADQPRVAERVAELGAGVALEKTELSADLLRDTANRVLETPSYREAAARVGESLRSAGGARQAADEIMKYVSQVNVG
ncbi:glycosyltransferase, MGT family [Paenibacillus tianmuensis]|uniref:Glycosyltransferase, MGT family n=1 Tax=Paenibacillus tianmuensis TaxID=624147 RepID=A0A1G4SG84_9BACL|nr:macrolide family glycosyltransferase [Paenibacillus tianmuensis]SCW68222.1 glycosyltransferase, MGT family [Paenibacillus tianmuensis]